VTAARGAFLLAGELAVAPDIQQPRVSRLDRGVNFFLRRDHAVARTRNERRRFGRHLALLDRPALGGPFLDAAFHHGHLVVSVAAQR
jgi:hypothetical protein